MSKLIHASICVSDIPKELIKSHTNGKKYLSIDIWVNDEPDKYDNDCSFNISQSKEEREAKAKKIYIGNGKTKFGFSKSEPTQDTHNAAKSNGYAPEPRRTAAGGVAMDKDEDFDDVPF